MSARQAPGTRPAPAGGVFGTAGGSLSGGNTAFAHSREAAEIGAAGERLTAAVLDPLAARFGVAVLHDLRIPGTKANIDHLVLAGNRAWVIDSKVWRAPGYRTRGRGESARHFRGGSWWRRGEEFPQVGKASTTVTMACDRLLVMFAEHARRSGVRLELGLPRPLLVVWPSSARYAGKLNLSRLRVPGADVVAGDRVEARVTAFAKRHGAADTGVLAVLRQLLNGAPPTVTGPSDARSDGPGENRGRHAMLFSLGQTIWLGVEGE